MDAQDARGIVERVRGYIERFEQEVSALVAEEHYVQRLEARVSSSTSHSTRELTSDYVLVKPADAAGWIGYRDIFEVDGVPVRSRDQRVVDILSSTSPDSHARAAAFALEGARFNLGPMRTVNVPTMPLQLMSRRHAGRITMRADRINSRTGTARVRFAEPNPPTIVRTPGDGFVFSRGDATIRLADGAILKASLYFRFPIRRAPQEATMTVEYAEVPGISVPVPARMTESHPRVENYSASGEATYSNYRRFQAFSRIR